MGSLNLTICTHDRSQFRVKRGVFQSMFANIFVREIFKKGVFFENSVLVFLKKGSFLSIKIYLRKLKSRLKYFISTNLFASLRCFRLVETR